MNENIEKWLKEPQNIKKIIMGLLALNLLACSALLFITASGQGALYDAIKPSVVEEKHILQKQYLGNITVDEVEYKNVLILDVIDLDENNIASKKSHQLYFEKEKTTRFDLNAGDIIVCTWEVQITGERRITSVVNLDTYNKVYNGIYTLN